MESNLQVYYDFLKNHRLDTATVSPKVGIYYPITEDGTPGPACHMLYEDIAFASRLYAEIKGGEIAGEPQEPREPSGNLPGKGIPKDVLTAQCSSAKFYEVCPRQYSAIIMLLMDGQGEHLYSLSCFQDMTQGIIRDVYSSPKYSYLEPVARLYINDLINTVHHELRLIVPQHFFQQVIRRAAIAKLHSRPYPAGYVFTPGDLARITRKFLYMNIRKIVIRDLRAKLYTYGGGFLSAELTLPEDERWAKSHPMLDMLPSIMLDIHHTSHFRRLCRKFDYAGVNYDSRQFIEQPTMDHLEREYRSLKMLIDVMLEDTISVVRHGDFFNCGDSDETTLNKLADLRYIAGLAICKKLVNLSGQEHGILREAAERQFDVVVYGHLAPDGWLAHGLRCMALLKRLVRVAVIRAIYELRKGGRIGAEKALYCSAE